MSASPHASRAPRAPGLPLLGSAWGATMDPCRFFARSHLACGPVFRVAYPGRTMTMLAGLDANRLFALEGARLFSASRTYERVSREFGTRSYPNAQDGAAHQALRQLLAPSLSALGIEPFLPRVFEMIRNRARSWPRDSVAALAQAAGTLVSDVVAVCTTGQPVGTRLSRDINYYATWMGVVAVGKVLPEFTLYLPPIRAARTRFARFMEERLAEHRAHASGLDRDPDLLDALLAAAIRDPGGFDAPTLLALSMIPMKNAGIYLYRLVSFVLYETLRRPDLLERVTAEADAALAEGTPGLEELRRMQTLEAVILEALRLYPLAIALPRVVAEPFEFGGFSFREGETVYIAGPATHFVPELFPDPGRFDPERYSQARSEHRRPHAFAPFGFGTHACAARGYSQTLAAAIVAGIVHTVRLRVHPEGKRLTLRALPVPIPEAKFRVRVVEQREPERAPAAAPTVRERLSTALWLLTPERRETVFADLRQESFVTGATIFRQGDPPDRFYVVQRGEVEILLDAPGGGTRAVARLGPAQHFGETGILQGVPRTATVRSVARTTVLSLGREAFNALAVEADVTRQELVALMERRALVNTLALALPRLAADAAGRLATVCATRSYPAGTAIVTQGEEADRFYLLLRGRVEVLVRPPVGTEFLVATLEAVDCFGEAGIFLRRPRAATVRALGPVTVLEVPREQFEAMVAGSAETGADLARIATERLLALAEATGGPPG